MSGWRFAALTALLLTACSAAQSPHEAWTTIGRNTWIYMDDYAVCYRWNYHLSCVPRITAVRPSNIRNPIKYEPPEMHDGHSHREAMFCSVEGRAFQMGGHGKVGDARIVELDERTSRYFCGVTPP